MTRERDDLPGVKLIKKIICGDNPRTNWPESLRERGGETEKIFLTSISFFFFLSLSHTHTNTRPTFFFFYVVTGAIANVTRFVVCCQSSGTKASNVLMAFG